MTPAEEPTSAAERAEWLRFGFSSAEAMRRLIEQLERLERERDQAVAQVAQLKRANGLIAEEYEQDQQEIRTLLYSLANEDCGNCPIETCKPPNPHRGGACEKTKMGVRCCECNDYRARGTLVAERDALQATRDSLERERDEVRAALENLCAALARKELPNA